MSAMEHAVAKATLWVVLETAAAQASAFLLFVVFARILSSTTPALRRRPAPRSGP